MQISMYSLIFYNFIIGILIIIFGFKIIISGIEHILLEKKIKESQTESKRYDSFYVFMEDFIYVKKNFWINFFILEVLLIVYFSFWGILFYYGAILK